MRDKERDNIESLQLLNTAIIKSRERKTNAAYEERLKSICRSPVIEAINISVNYLSELQQISRDQSAMQIIETILELDSLWSDYVVMEGIDRIKGMVSKRGCDQGQGPCSHHQQAQAQSQQCGGRPKKDYYEN
ncbi:MAG: hypothetical protein HQK52_16150 [Oligoflexia bacterium]|nr:hypothetical protein [Oligoflexia bacterium]